MRALLLAALLAWGAAQADPVVFGLDTVSHHFPSSERLSNVNPGLYVRRDGLSAGAYRNSFSRASFWVGYTLEYGAFGLTLGAVTGYQVRTTTYDYPCGSVTPPYSTCRLTVHDKGNTRGAVGAMVLPSVALPELYGVTPRLSLIPKFTAAGSTVVHLSLEHTF